MCALRLCFNLRTMRTLTLELMRDEGDSPTSRLVRRVVAFLARPRCETQILEAAQLILSNMVGEPLRAGSVTGRMRLACWATLPD
jgi:hypothetical protein